MIEITPAAYNFLLAEVQAVHKACDLAGIPRETEEGGKLSMAQRAMLLAENAVRLGDELTAVYEELDGWRSGELRAP